MKIFKKLSLFIFLIFIGCGESEETSVASSSGSVQEVCGTEETFSNPATFCQIQQGLLIPKCVSCHDGGRLDIGSNGDYDSLFALGWVEANNLAASSMFVRMEAGDITNTVITDEELDAVESWILDGAPNNGF